MGRTAWISTLGGVRGTRMEPRGRRCARLHRVFSRLETKRKIIADDAFLKGIDQQILNSPQQRSGSHRAHRGIASFALKSETSRVAARDDLSVEEVRPMQPLLVRWGRFSMRIPGEVILFLLSKIALLIAYFQQ